MFTEQAWHYLGPALSVALMAISGGISWFMKELWDAVRSLRQSVSDIKDEVAAMELSSKTAASELELRVNEKVANVERALPMVYVQKADYKIEVGRIYELLDRIYKKLDKDKSDE